MRVRHSSTTITTKAMASSRAMMMSVVSPPVFVRFDLRLSGTVDGTSITEARARLADGAAEQKGGGGKEQR